MVLLHLHVSFGFKLTRHRLLPELTEQVELSLVLNVSQVVLLGCEWRKMEMEEHGKKEKYQNKTQHLNLGLTEKRNR